MTSGSHRRPSGYRSALLAPAIVLLLAGGVLAIEPTKTPVSPDGVRATVDIPATQHLRNAGGMGRRGPGTGDGLCVFTSCEVASTRWQNGNLSGFQKWMTTRPGGGDPKKLQQMITAFCKEKGLKEPDYVQHTGGDAAFLEEALKTRRMVCVTYAGSDDFYSGGIDHMVDLAHMDATRAAIIDNNRPGAWVWMTRSEFLTRWKARGGGWAVCFLNSPPPPATAAPQTDLAGCPCGDGCVCAPGDCPAKCPTRHAQPKAEPKVVDRSGSSVLVCRDLGAGRTACGTGTVVQSDGRVSLVLTNAHVAEDAARPLSVVLAGKTYPAKYVAGSTVRSTGPNSIAVDGPDLALLSVAADLVAVPVADKAPAVGTPVYQWGYGKTTDGGPTFKAGKCLDAKNYAGPVQLTSIASQNGDSGSGIFDAQGRLVAVGWGGTDGTQFAVRLDAVKEFLAPHLKAPVAAEVAPADAGENHGINRTELDNHTKDGRKTYWINGREVGRPQALDAVAAGGLGLVDDSDRYHLSIVTADPAAVRAALADPKLATALGRVHVQVYAPTDWPVKDRGLKSAVTLQDPAPKGGRVLWTAEVLDAATLADGLKRADPNYRPEPVAPVMPAPVPPAVQPAPVPPAPAPTPAVPAPPPEPAPIAPAPAQPAPAQPQPSNTLLYLILAIGGILLLRRRTN